MSENVTSSLLQKTDDFLHEENLKKHKNNVKKIDSIEDMYYQQKEKKEIRKKENDNIENSIDNIKEELQNDSDDLYKLVGKDSKELKNILLVNHGDEIIHRNNFVFLENN